MNVKPGCTCMCPCVSCKLIRSGKSFPTHCPCTQKGAFTWWKCKYNN